MHNIQVILCTYSRNEKIELEKENVDLKPVKCF